MVLEVGNDVRLQGVHSARSDVEPRGLVVLLHGWEGSSDSNYMQLTAARLLAAGFAVFRLNFRDHGDSHHLNEGLFHSNRIDEIVDALRAVAARWPIQPLDPNYRGEVATRYRFEDGAGEVGFVSSISESFCGDCHRARVSADGRLYTCLFSAEGTDLRGMVAQGEDALVEHVTGLWSRRSDRYSELRGERIVAQGKHVEMFLIGG